MKRNETKLDQADKTEDSVAAKSVGRTKRRKGFKSSKKSGSKSKFEARGREDSSNDPKWYSTTPAITMGAANIPFSWSVGTPIDVNMPNSFPNGLLIPGILTLHVTPSIGLTENPTDPINVASAAVYSYVRHANSGHANYEHQDLMIYLIAMGEVYCYINFLMRAYGVATLYSQQNRYLPKGLLAAMMIDANDVQANLANFRYGINVLIHKAASMAVPATMTYFQRLAFLYQNIYTEGTSVKDQMYFYSPGSFHKFQLDDNQAGMLKTVIYGSQTHKVSDLIAFGNDMLDPIIGNEDMNIMSGDILKAYGTNNILKLMELPEYLPVLPVFNIGVLEQIKNAFPQVVDIPTLDIKQDATRGCLVSRPTALNVDNEFLNMRYLLTTTTAETNPDLVMESTRLMTAYAKRTGTDSAYLYSGSEIVTSAQVWLMDKNGAIQKHLLSNVGNMENAEQIKTALKTMSYASSFRFHPRMDAKYSGLHYPMFDIDNFAVLTNAMLQRIHEAALLSMFNVSAIAKLT